MSIVKELQRWKTVQKLCEQEGFDNWFESDTIVLSDTVNNSPEFRCYSPYEAYAFLTGYIYAKYKTKQEEVGND